MPVRPGGVGGNNLLKVQRNERPRRLRDRDVDARKGLEAPQHLGEDGTSHNPKRLGGEEGDEGQWRADGCCTRLHFGVSAGCAWMRSVRVTSRSQKFAKGFANRLAWWGEGTNISGISRLTRRRGNWLRRCRRRSPRHVRQDVAGKTMSRALKSRIPIVGGDDVR
jgi:hypothetical protein